jgi:hypothetical protein
MEESLQPLWFCSSSIRLRVMKYIDETLSFTSGFAMLRTKALAGCLATVQLV